MSSIVAIGTTHELEGFALAGVRVIPAPGDAAVAAWADLDAEVGLVILSPEAAQALDGHLAERPDVLTLVMP